MKILYNVYMARVIGVMGESGNKIRLLYSNLNFILLFLFIKQNKKL